MTRTRRYEERYKYDPVGNLTQLRHQATGGFTRNFTLVPDTNRLALSRLAPGHLINISMMRTAT